MIGIKNTFERFGIGSQLLHWSIAILVFTNIYLIFFVIDSLPENDPLVRTYIFLHKSIGVTILLLALMFIGWRVFNVKPTYPRSMSTIEVKAATFVHHFLLLLVVLMPISGILMSYFGGRPTNIFNLFTIAALQTPNKFWSGIFFDIHATIATLLIVTLGVHIFAALLHHVVRHDNVLRRMLPMKLKNLK